MTEILPVLDNELLQQKANEYAMKGALKTLEEFYCGYDSPYRKAIEENLKGKGVASNFDIPDIVANINEALSNEVDRIANESVAKTFVPLLKQFLTREPEEMKFSDFLKRFILETETKNYDDCSLEIKTHTEYDWLDIYIGSSDRDYRITFHLDWESRKTEQKKYMLLSLGHDTGKNASKVMKLRLDSATLEVPFTTGIINDGFNSFMANLVLSNTKITMDCTDFEEDMFPRGECYCD